MRTLRLRQPRWISRMGRILTHVTIVNALDPAREISCQALVDTGAWDLKLPRAWKERLGAFQMTRTVDMVTADQRVVSGEVCGPVTIQIEGFEPGVERDDLRGHGARGRRIRTDHVLHRPSSGRVRRRPGERASCEVSGNDP